MGNSNEKSERSDACVDKCFEIDEAGNRFEPESVDRSLVFGGCVAVCKAFESRNDERERHDDGSGISTRERDCGK